MKQESPVFIVGQARSGTSILYHTLQRHSSFRPKSINLVEAGLFSHYNRAYWLKDNDSNSLRAYMLNSEPHYDEFLRSIRLVRALHRLALLRPDDPLFWQLTLNHLVARSFFYYAQQARGCKRIVEKTPNNVRYIERILLTFPKCRLLYIYRHPVDVFSSYRRRGLMKGESQYLLTADEFCRKYRESLSAVWLVRGVSQIESRSPCRQLYKVQLFLPFVYPIGSITIESCSDPLTKLV